jgi:hypothetical protein
MGLASPLWGGPRIHGELLKLGIQVSQAAVANYMIRRASAFLPTTALALAIAYALIPIISAKLRE